MDLETLQQLLSSDGRDVLREATEAYGALDPLTLGTRLRRAGHSPALVAAATSQVALRHRARGKLGADAVRMYFTPDALEQATRRQVSAHRTGRLRQLGVRTIVDLGCGVGADLVAFAHAGLDVRGVELDPVRAAIAQANLAALGLDGQVTTADATTYDTTPYDAVFVDPARRSGHGRTFDPQTFTPPWPFVRDLLTGPAAAKMLPGIAHDLVPDGVEAEWVSEDGDLVEACLWGRDFAGAVRRATVITGESIATLVEHDAPVDVAAAAPGEWLYEPDDAVIRAGLVTAVAALTGGWLLDPHLAYVSSDRHVSTPFARAYRVVEELPFREKALRAALRERDIGTLTVKKRGVSLVPEALVKRLRLTGSRTAVVVATRVRGDGRVFLVEPHA